MRLVVEFTQHGRYLDKPWEGEIRAEKGVHKAISPSLAMHLINHGRAIAVFEEDGSPRTVYDSDDYSIQMKTKQ